MNNMNGLLLLLTLTATHTENPACEHPNQNTDLECSVHLASDRILCEWLSRLLGK